MSAAFLQGVPASTLDTELWVDLPERQYIRLMNLVVGQGGTAIRPTVYALADGSLINFIFQVHGLKDFASEYKRALTMKLRGVPVKVLPLEAIVKSKETIRRDKDLAHLPLLRSALKLRRRVFARRTP